MRVAFVVPERDGAVADLAAGHARRLTAEHGIAAEVRDVAGGDADVVVAVGAGAAHVEHDVLLLHAMEDRSGVPDAAAEHERPGAVIATARWIAEELDALRAGRVSGPVLLVRSGIDKDVFTAPAQLRPAVDGPLRIAAVGAAVSATAQMETPHTLDVVGPGRPAAERAARFAAADVVLVAAPVVGDARVSLEGFHCAATTVTTPVNGHDEHVADGVNGLVASFDDDRGTARLLDLLARDRRLLHELRLGALATARAWPSLRQNTAMLAAALRRAAAGAAG